MFPVELSCIIRDILAVSFSMDYSTGLVIAVSLPVSILTHYSFVEHFNAKMKIAILYNFGQPRCAYHPCKRFLDLERLLIAEQAKYMSIYAASLRPI
jgi:hypothetical protein